GGTADRNRSHWSTSKTPSYTKSVSWQHHLFLFVFIVFVLRFSEIAIFYLCIFFCFWLFVLCFCVVVVFCSTIFV
ncbi:hypothetical protein SND23_16545, partial [Escherichia coli]|nr:hypothetical protein [Escherichia coli]MDZ9205880.1 hypothetical protein [Escherichia coli]MDZ9841554.1 hypothetical protein [Escherichia coli]